MTTLSIDSLTADPSGSENGLVVRNIPSGIQVVEVTDGYGNILGTSTNPLITSSGSTTRTTKLFTAINQSVSYLTEAMLSLTPSSDFSSGSSGTSFGVTSGKKLRLQGMYLISGGPANINLRGSNSGSTTTGSLLITNYGLIDFPGDGIELSGTMEFGISAVQFQGVGAVNVSFVVFGYEY